MQRRDLGCVGEVANGINTGHLAYLREGTGHALIGPREWIPAAYIGDVCGDEVYGSCTQLREYLEKRGQASVLRVRSSFGLAPPGGVTLACKQAAARLTGVRGWEFRSAGTGSKGQRCYAWA